MAHAARIARAALIGGMLMFGWAPLPIATAQVGTPTSTAFTYQGELKQAGAPASGVYDMQFRLYDVLTGSTQLASTCLDDVTVTAGRFSVQLDFGTLFAGTSPRFLEIDVRPGAGVNCTTATGYTTLTPRQPVTAAPRAQSAQFATQLVTPLGAGAAVVDSAGRVGVGTSLPQASLHVQAPVLGEAIRIQGTSSSVGNMVWLNFVNGAGAQVGYVGDGSQGDNNVFLSSTTGNSVLNTAAGRVVTATAGGRVGIMTTTPQATLDVNGSIKVAPTIRWKSIHGSAFIPGYLDNSSFGTQGGLTVVDSFGTSNSGTVGDAGSSGPAYYFAPVDLPDGCTVVDVCVDGRDEHSTQDIVVSLGKITLGSGFVTEIATTFTAGSSVSLQHACNGNVSETIDNANNVYFLRCRMATSGSNIHWLLAARVKYTVTSPLP